MIKKTIMLIAIILLTGCGKKEEPLPKNMKLVWRESSNTRLEDARTPDRFYVTPEDVIEPILRRKKRYAWSEILLFADKDYYYIVYSSRNQELKYPDKNTLRVHGRNGKTIEPKRNTNVNIF